MAQLKSTGVTGSLQATSITASVVSASVISGSNVFATSARFTSLTSNSPIASSSYSATSSYGISAVVATKILSNPVVYPSGNGQDVTIIATDGDPEGNDGYGGNVNISSGNGYFAGNINIIAGTASLSDSDGGTVNIKSGVGPIVGDINITAANGSGSINLDGTVTMTLGNSYKFALSSAGIAMSTPLTSSFPAIFQGVTSSLFGTSSVALLARTASISTGLSAVGDYKILSLTASIISASGGITGSLFGSASYAISSSNALTASMSRTASYALNASSPSQWTSSGANIYIDTANVGIGTGDTISAKHHIISTTEQQRIGYNTSNYISTAVDSSGNATISSSTGGSFKFNGLIGVNTNSPRGALDVNYINRIGTVTGQAAFFGSDNPTYAYDDSNLGFKFDIYAYKIISGIKIFSTAASFAQTDHPGGGEIVYIGATWNPVSGADGYRVIVDSDPWFGAEGDYYFDTTDTTFTVGEIGPVGYVNSNGYVGLYILGNTVTPTSTNTSLTFDTASKLTVYGTGEQMRISYNTSSYMSTTISSSGAIFDLTGSNPRFTFNKGIVGNFTGSVQGTSSFATTASYARISDTASYAFASIGTLTTGQHYPITSSWATSSFTSSLSDTASYAVTASYAFSAIGTLNTGDTYPITSSWAITASYANNLNTANAYQISILTASIISASSGITGSLFGTASMANSLNRTNSYAITRLTASIISASSGITGSLFGTATTASFVLTASYANNLNTANAYQISILTASIISASSGITGSLFGTASLSTTASHAVALNSTGNYSINILTASIISASSGITGSLLGTASLSITASNSLTASSLLRTNSYIIDILTASIISASSGITGSLFGTSSFATTASNALTASSLIRANSYVITRLTASIISASSGITGSLFGTASLSISSSYGLTASYALTGVPTQAELIPGAFYPITSSWATSSVSASHLRYPNNSTASFAITSSFAVTASFSTTASWSNTSSFSTTASWSNTSSFSTTASYALNAGSGYIYGGTLSPISASVTATGPAIYIQSGSIPGLWLMPAGSSNLSWVEVISVVG